jgi:hypothetical protein
MAEPDHEKAYEDGKHRRYNLLFAVNGGAFAIAKLLVGTAKEPGAVVGELHLCHLAYGMAVFTTAMAVDIGAFGLRMRGKNKELFGWIGWAVLLIIGSLIVAGWMLAGCAEAWAVWAAVAAHVVVVGCLLLILWWYGPAKPPGDATGRSPPTDGG